MLLSPKAKAAAARLKSFDEDDLHSLSEVIQHEVHHATDVLAQRARAAEARIRELADQTSGDVTRVGRQAKKTVEDNPVPTGLAILGVGLLLGLIFAARR